MIQRKRRIIEIDSPVQNSQSDSQSNMDTSKKKKSESKVKNEKTYIDISSIDLKPSIEKTNGKYSRQKNQKSLLKVPDSNPDLLRYVEGSIMKIVMDSFVAYDHCELHPGPNLNMIIGPNGSGKSTVVCAIALGLGGSPQLLGRTKEINGFVKHGFDSGFVELTLKGPGKNSITTIRRTLNSKTNSSTYKLNGQVSTAIKVNEVVKALNIQLDNLCQFLPQDRVVEFSKLNGPELLKETQRAIGQESLLNLQLKLVELKNEESKHFFDLENEVDAIKHLEHRNKQLERDVERLNEYTKAEKSVKILEIQLPLKRLDEAKNIYSQKKEIRKEKIKEYKDLLKKITPLKKSLDETLVKERALSEKKREQNNKIRRSNENIRHALNSVQNNEQKTVERRNEISEIINRFTKIESEAKELEADIAHMETELGPKPNDEKVRDINSHIKKILDDESLIRSDLREVQDKIHSIKNEGDDAHQSMTRFSQKLTQLENIKSRKLTLMKTFNNDTAVGFEYLETTRSDYREHVYGPISFEIRLIRPDCANILESVIGSSTLKTFVCQNEGDYRTLTRKLNDEKRLRTNATMLNHLNISDFKPPVEKDVLLKWGFDCYAIDLLEAPPPVLVAMCSQDNIHRIPISFSNDVDHNAIEASGKIKTYVANGVKYVINRSRYGSRSSATAATRIKPPNRVNLLGVGDTTEMQQARVETGKQIEKLQQILLENEKKLKSLNLEEQKLNLKIESELQPQAMHYRRLKDSAMREMQNWERNNVKLESKKIKLANILKTISNKDSEQMKQMSNINKEVSELSLERLNQLSKISKLSKECRQNYTELASLTISLFQLSNDHLKIKTVYNDSKEKLELANAEYLKSDEETKKAKEVANKCLELVKNLASELSAEEQQEASDANGSGGGEMSASEMEARLAAAKQRLSLFSRHGVSSNVIADFKKGSNDLEKKYQNIDKIKSKLEEIKKLKEKIRGEWEPSLRNLVDIIDVEFGKAMKYLDCLGEVRLVTSSSSIHEPSNYLQFLKDKQNDTSSKQPGDSSNKKITEDVDNGNTGTKDGVVRGNRRKERLASSQPARDNGNDLVSSSNSQGNSTQINSNVISNNDEGFDNWGIEIWVSFRSGEPTVLLTEQRQSGGERAVSTALYLQAIMNSGPKIMQSQVKAKHSIVKINATSNGSRARRNKIAQSDDDSEDDSEDIIQNTEQADIEYIGVPFRVVDEVNQGMDQRNERLIHSQIVRTACQLNSPQYFLITPKLLPKLDYHQNMKVHCIFNGEWQPPTFDVRNYIKNRIDSR
ncbi:Structural maintenance of chromosomes protein 5 [Smittium mucronatum]|uniref:Structural maintenance of chromosomes protein 5 n=1 Tax=Smittium mucronatum TaxID=133383 RepID=A0A1R0H4Q7_9FUNG|nr:Structural maintenance of chromosomes protein 5 [Smittium mucronatum]